MRFIIFGIIDKNTGKAIFKSHSLRECERRFAELTNSEQYAIGHRFYSI